MVIVRRSFLIALVIAAGVALATVAPAARQFPDDATIRAIVRERVASGRSTGIVVGLLEADGRRRYIAYNEQRHGEPVFDQRTVFEIGSITKVFTTSLLADMVARGEVRLDDPVAKYLLDSVKVPSRGGREITLQDLATQTSGLPRMPANFAPANPANPYADYTDDRMFAFLSGYTLTRDIGSRFEYSNLGLGLLGVALTRHAGLSYEQLVTERILQPLGMTSTAVALRPELQARLAPGHAASGTPVANWDLDAFAGAGALRSTAEDMLTFLAAQLNPGSSPIATRMAMTHAARAGTGGKDAIGLGWQIMMRPDRQIRWHNGGTGGYRTWAGFDFGHRRAAVVLTNSSNGHDDLGVHLLDPSVPLTPPPVPASERKVIDLSAQALEPLVGEYELAPGFTIVFTRDGNQLFGQATNQPRFRYWPESPTRFFLKEVEAQIEFVKDAGGHVTGLTLFQAGQKIPGKKIK
jgi:CubicO group peptidase (beta-lactamase class C family)